MIKNLIFDFGKVLVDYDFEAFFRRYHAKEALKQAKLAKELTQEEADEKMGICT